jgi:hypothetical protein
MFLASASSWWLPLASAALPTVAAIGAAVIAARSAREARVSGAETERLRRLEERVAARKYDIYKPMIELLRDMIDPVKGPQLAQDKEVPGRLGDFASWISIYGSDDAVDAYHKFMQGAYHNAPPEIVMRLYLDFVLATRRDLGYEDTRVSGAAILGIRVNDIYDDAKFYRIVTLPFEELCTQLNWTAPWTRPPVVVKDADRESPGRVTRVKRALSPRRK